MEPLRKRPRAPTRTREDYIRRIHAIARARNLSDEERKDIQAALTGGIRSCADMSIEQLAHVESRLGAGQPRGRARPKLSPQQAKVFAMWKALEATGALRNGEYSGLRAFVKHHALRDDLSFCDFADCDKLIDELRGWGRRVGADMKG